MKITVLGCGSSSGVPMLGNNWGNCDPSNPRNRRRRSSILVEEGDTVILVDTSPDMREQLLDCNLQTLTALIYTHAHADHINGMDDLRSVNWLTQKPIQTYGDLDTLDEIRSRFDYVFPDKTRDPKDYSKPVLEAHLLNGPIQIGSIHITPFRQNHGQRHSLGLRFNDFAYSPDVKDLDENAFNTLQGLKLWLVDALTERVNVAHAHVDLTLSWIERLQPQHAYLTHMGPSLDYATLLAKLPQGVEPAYDGLVVEI